MEGPESPAVPGRFPRAKVPGVSQGPLKPRVVLSQPVRSQLPVFLDTVGADKVPTTSLVVASQPLVMVNYH